MFSTGKGRWTRSGLEGATEALWRYNLVLGSPDAAVDSAQRSYICLHMSLRRFACQSAGWLSALFLNQHPCRLVCSAGGGCSHCDEQRDSYGHHIASIKEDNSFQWCGDLEWAFESFSFMYSCAHM